MFTAAGPGRPRGSPGTGSASSNCAPPASLRAPVSRVRQVVGARRGQPRQRGRVRVQGHGVRFVVADHRGRPRPAGRRPALSAPLPRQPAARSEAGRARTAAYDPPGGAPGGGDAHCRSPAAAPARPTLSSGRPLAGSGPMSDVLDLSAVTVRRGQSAPAGRRRPRGRRRRALGRARAERRRQVHAALRRRGPALPDLRHRRHPRRDPRARRRLRAAPAHRPGQHRPGAAPSPATNGSATSWSPPPTASPAAGARSYDPTTRPRARAAGPARRRPPRRARLRHPQRRRAQAHPDRARPHDRPRAAAARRARGRPRPRRPRGPAAPPHRARRRPRRPRDRAGHPPRRGDPRRHHPRAAAARGRPRRGRRRSRRSSPPRCCRRPSVSPSTSSTATAGSPPARSDRPRAGQGRSSSVA